jgi:Mg/Co/Ni transporter MgtE
MRADNPLTAAFVATRPTAAARILESLTPSESAAFLADISAARARRIAELLSAPYAAQVLAAMSGGAAAALLRALPPPTAARILRAAPDRAEELLGALPARQRLRLNALLGYPARTVGAAMDAAAAVLPVDIDVESARRKLRARTARVNAEIYVVDALGAPVGVVTTPALLRAKRAQPVQSIMDLHIHPLQANALLAAAADNEGWSHHHSLPVVDSDGALLGVLPYSAVRASASDQSRAEITSRLIEAVTGVTGVYWLVLAESLQSMINLAPGTAPRNDREEDADAQ